MKKVIALSALAAGIGGMQAAQAVDINAGDFTVNVGGIINAYYTHVNCSGDAVGGIALAGRALGCGGQGGRTTIGNGLLPSGLITSVKTHQGDYDIGGTIGIMVHTATDSAIAANSGVDVRQGFLTIGNAGMGTVKLGRDYGIFGANAILSDMTLLGAGAPVQATQRGRVTLGHIGAGYTYLGTYGQVAYTSPSFSGVKLDAALVSPVDAGNNASGNGPQFQAQLSAAPVEGAKAWVGYKHQKFNGAPATSPSFALDPTTGNIVSNPGTPAGPGFNLNAGEIGASYTYGPFGVLANFQAGKGLGILSDGDSGDVKQRNYFIQATYKATEKVKLGLNYGQSKLRDNITGVANSLEKNSNVTAGVYYSLTKSVTLVGELGQTRSEAFSGDVARMKGGSVGAIFFF